MRLLWNTGFQDTYRLIYPTQVDEGGLDDFFGSASEDEAPAKDDFLDEGEDEEDNAVGGVNHVQNDSEGDDEDESTPSVRRKNSAALDEEDPNPLVAMAEDPMMEEDMFVQEEAPLFAPPVIKELTEEERAEKERREREKAEKKERKRREREEARKQRAKEREEREQREREERERMEREAQEERDRESQAAKAAIEAAVARPAVTSTLDSDDEDTPNPLVAQEEEFR